MTRSQDDDIRRDDSGAPISKWSKFTEDDSGLTWDLGQSISLNLSDEELQSIAKTAGPWLFQNFMRFALKVNRNPDPSCLPEERFSIAMMASCLIGDNRIMPICIIGATGSSVEEAMVRLSAWCIETRKEADMAMKWGILYRHPNAPNAGTPDASETSPL